MELLHILLIIHIGLGSLSLIIGTYILFSKKGDLIHKRLGKVFSYAMLVTAFLALILSYVRYNTFLFIVGVFSIYLIGTGTRYINLKPKGDQMAKPKFWDWFLTISMLIAGIIFICYGSLLLIKSNYFGIVLLAFGIIGLSGVRQDIRYYRGLEKSIKHWLRTHIARMVGGYIAAFTAFLVNNASMLPEIIPGFVYWLLPTLVLFPIIIKWINKYAPEKK